ncbi:MAG: hypothetical protein MUP86_02305 [Dehalococcoidia bacterium]|nr:hypothetical protein [Dehalococcoidia bacterium]
MAVSLIGLPRPQKPLAKPPIGPPPVSPPPPQQQPPDRSGVDLDEARRSAQDAAQQVYLAVGTVTDLSQRLGDALAKVLAREDPKSSAIHCVLERDAKGKISGFTLSPVNAISPEE